MQTSTLHFPSIIELVDFQGAANADIQHFNLADLTLTGNFSEADIELAKAGFEAVVVETDVK
jgi:hypothetical protein